MGKKEPTGKSYIHKIHKSSTTLHLPTRSTKLKSKGQLPATGDEEEGEGPHTSVGERVNWYPTQEYCT